MMQRSLEGVLVLLAEPDSFCASYLSDVVKQAGAQVLAPFINEDLMCASCQDLHDQPAVAVISSSLSEKGRGLMLEQMASRNIPVLVVADCCGRQPSPDAAFHWPFGGFQVAEALSGLIAAKHV